MEEKGNDISKRLALILIVLTVIISAACTWVLISSTSESDSTQGAFGAIIHLNILKGKSVEPVLTDSNSGNVQLNIVNKKGG